MAGVTGLEPATSGVTGQRSNQLSYTPLIGVAALKMTRHVRERRTAVKQLKRVSRALTVENPLTAH